MRFCGRPVAGADHRPLLPGAPRADPAGQCGAALRRVASVLRFGGDPFVDHEARQVGQAGGDARLAAGALRDAPAHPFRGGLCDGIRKARAVMHLAIHPVGEVASVAAVQEGADRGGIRAGRVVNCGEGDRPGLVEGQWHRRGDGDRPAQ
jgi:hypothetical protein